MYKQQQITQKLEGSFDFSSLYDSFAVHTLIKSTKIKMLSFSVSPSQTV